MADFTKPSHTQNSDEIVTLLNSKIEALAKMSLIDGTWTNVPVGTVAYDVATSQFKRKTGADTWTSVEISLGDESSLTLDSLTTNTIASDSISTDSINTDSITLVANPTTNNQTLTAASYKLLKDEVDILKTNSIDIVTGSEGTDFNITIESAGSGVEGSEDELGSSTIIKKINLPSASETARGVVTTDTQTFGGTKTFASGNIQLGNSNTASNNWHISSGEKLKILSGNLGSGIERVTIDASGKIGAGTNTPDSTLHLKNTLAGITLEDTSVGATGKSSITTTSRNLTVDADSINLFNKLVVQSSGNVGIGTSAPEELLHLRSSSPRIRLEDTDISSSIYGQISANTEVGGIVLQADPTNSAANSYIGFDVDGSERVRITSNGDVGIGSSSPTQKLHVSGSIYSDGAIILQNSAPTIYLQDTDHRSCAMRCNNNTFTVVRATGTNSISTDSTSLSVDLETGNLTTTGSLNVSGKNLNLGTTTNNWNQTATGATIEVAGNLGLMTLNGTAHLALNTYWNSSSQWIRKTAGAASLFTMSSDGGFVWYSAASAAANSQITTWTSSTSLSSSGNLTTTGNVLINNSAPTVHFQDTDNTSAMIHVNSNIFYILRGTANNSTTWQNPPYPMYINLSNNYAYFGGPVLAGGNVYPNSALTNQSISVSTQLESVGSLFLYNAAAGAVVTGTSNTFRNYTDSNGHFLPYDDNAYLLGRWDSVALRRWNNIFLVGGPTYPSDQRDKFDIQDSALGLNFICSLRPVSYKYKVAENIVEKTGELEESGTAKTTITPREGVRNHYGFIAQEVRQALNDDSFAGWALLNKDDPESKQALVYTEFISPMVKAIQELNAKISMLEQKIADLEK